MKYQFGLLTLYFTIAFVPDANSQPTPTEVRQFVRSDTFPQSYRGLTEAYDASASAVLGEMLNSSSETSNRGRIATLLGAVGDDRAGDALIAFIEKPASTEHISFEHEDARTSAMRALGYLVYRTGNERALKYLIDSLTPGVWRQRGLTGMAPWAETYQQYDRSLSIHAISALAYTGHPAAAEALTSFQQAPTSGQAQLRSTIGDGTVPQWLEVHRLVAERGLDGMYEYYAAKRREDNLRQEPEANRERAQREAESAPQP